MSPRAIGTKFKLVADEETTYKADPGTVDGRLVPITSVNIKGSQELLKDGSIRGDRSDYRPKPGNINVAGSIACNLSETPHAMLLKHLLGAVTTTGAGDPYTHTLKIGALPVGLVLNKEFTGIGQYHKFNGCRIASGEFGVAPNNMVTASFNVVGAKETVSATPYDATITELAYEPFTGFEGSILEGGAAIATVTDFKVNISNELDEDGYALGGSGEKRDLPEGNCVVSGSIEAFFEDDTLLAKARNSTESSLKITLDKGVTPARTLEIFIPELVFERTGPEVSGPKGIKVPLSFQAYYDNSAEASSVQVIIQNGLSSI